MSSSKPQQQSAQRVGEALWSKMPKVNAELFTLTYGAMVMQLIKDHEEVDAVNAQLGEKNLTLTSCTTFDLIMSMKNSLEHVHQKKWGTTSEFVSSTNFSPNPRLHRVLILEIPLR